MFKKRCEVCGSTHTKKNGIRKGVQLYKCQDCGYQFCAGKKVCEYELWDAYQREDCKGMPNTNNKIEGSFTDLKKNLNNHSGLTIENRKRFISGFFLALTETLSMKKQEPR